MDLTRELKTNKETFENVYLFIRRPLRKGWKNRNYSSNNIIDIVKNINESTAVLKRLELNSPPEKNAIMITGIHK